MYCTMHCAPNSIGIVRYKQTHTKKTMVYYKINTTYNYSSHTTSTNYNQTEKMIQNINIHLGREAFDKWFLITL